VTTDAERQANAVERIIARGRHEHARKKRSSEWMFADHYPGTFADTGQKLDLAVLRLVVVAFYRPAGRTLRKIKRTTTNGAGV